MSKFHNILFVSHGLGGEDEGLKKALQLASANQTSLTILIACPSFPDSLGEYKTSYEQSIIERMEQEIKATKSALKISKKKLSIHLELECGSAPDVRIIQYALRHSHDLLIKQAETSPNQRGFKALDMELLRKCPCPLFMVRPAKHTGKEVKIAVAIDPKNEEQVGRELSLDLLKYASSLTHHYSGQLDIVSCWLFRLEEYLRDNIWIKVSESELDNMVLDEKHEQSKALEAIIKDSNIQENYQIHLQKGLPEEAIPSFVEHHEIDILVMGTVARTGISGFIIGNTAENILQKINCSLLALKPQGFVSPVKAY
ncbi:universal stress protein [Legionella israelensis]|uniref:Universal stress protein n=1 Tax=Legionella israelensis TaxID=454 RepID=A0AAX1EHT3_9GAMM|nr:universal stress protein [Legionella israelensis]QBR84746.1 universal stress protein [Legionella israelensis]